MKKLFSIVLMAALLVTCISPALYSSATDLPSFVIENNAEYEETTGSVDVSIGIADNPGISEMSVLVYYLESEMAIAKSEFGTVLNSSFNSVAGARPSNHPQLRSYFPADEFGSTIYQVTEVTLYAEDGDDAGNGTFLNLTFDLKGDHSAGNTFTYGVKIKSAVNAAGDEITFAGKQEGTLTFTPDPYKEIYKDFTVFATDAEVDLNAKEATVDVRLVNNPGIYVIRVFVAYDDALKLKSFTPVDGIFTNQGDKPEMTVSSDIAIVPPAEHGPDGILRALESKNISKEGKLVGYILCTPSAEENRNNDGVIARLTFELPENMQQGESFPVDVCWGDTDFTAIDMNSVDDKGNHPIVPVGDKTANGTGYITTATCEHANVVLEVVKDATCSETGLKSGVCPDCGQTVEEVIPMIDHTPGEAETIAPTCTEAGKIVTKCTVCQTVISSVEDAEHPALGHDEENATIKVVEAATCMSKGSQEVLCGRCNEVIRVEEIAMIPHTEKTETKAPTCTEAGRIITTCTVCGTEISNVEDTANPALGHKDGAPVVTKAATCTEKGSQDIFCERCETKLRTEEIDMIPHTEKVDTVAPTCTEAGKIITTCTVCGTEISNVEDTANPALGHKYETEIIAPTCTEAGKIVEKCTVCGDVESEIEDPDNPAIGHTPGEPEIVEPTATEDGSKTIKCTVCDEIISVEKIPATGVVTDDTTAPTTTDADDTTKAPANTTAPSNNNNKAPVKTGDNMIYVVIVAAIALVGCAAVVIIRKRKISDK